MDLLEVGRLEISALSNSAMFETEQAKKQMDHDPDIAIERIAVAAEAVGAAKISDHPLSSEAFGENEGTSLSLVPLSVTAGSHKSNRATASLVLEIGLPRLIDFTGRFYVKAFKDPTLEHFIRDHNDPHAHRFAHWIFEKMGGGDVWTSERKTRPVCPFMAHGQRFETAHDRSSAHYAAWHSPKRDEAVWGTHFQLDDCRVWMRLHFWAAREAGIFEHPRFADYYVRLIGHFVSVYERTAPPFARESARWSTDSRNIEAYAAAGAMADVLGQSLQEALMQLPLEERDYTGSNAAVPIWPYEL